MASKEDNRTPLLSAKGFGITAGGRTLFSGADFNLYPGQVALVAGPSGSGKTLLLKALCGLLDAGGGNFGIAGKIELNSPTGRRGTAGMVFQELALFDDLTASQNIRFGADHSKSGKSGRERRAWADKVAADLEIDLDIPLGSASQGQRQKVALARTLAFDADVILFDEPTSGLDPRQSRVVAGLVRRAAKEYGKAAVVVTHEYEYFRGIADLVLLLNPQSRTLSPVTLGQLDAFAASEEHAASAHAKAPGAVRRAASRAADFFDATASAAIEAALLPWRLLPLWRSPAWGLRFFLRYLSLVAFPSALAYIAIAGVIAGVVTTYFTFEYFPFKRFTEPIIIDDILASLGYAQYRLIVPVLVALLVAARCGAAAASDVGGRVYAKQADALRSFGADPARYIYANMLWAFLAGVPVLTALSFAVSQFASMIVYVFMHPQSSPMFWSHHFFGLLRSDGLFYKGTDWLAAKTAATALGVAAVSWSRGMAPKPSASSVNSGITSAVIRATLLVLAIHAVFAFFEFSSG